MDDARRRFCQAAGLALAGAALPACGAPCPTEPATCGVAAVAVGLHTSDIALGQAVARSTPTTNVFLCRDAHGLYAVDAGCTHLGCDVNFVDQRHGFLCPCHGATYSFNGDSPTGPARGPLKHYALCTTPSGILIVDLDDVVDACVRLVA